LIRSLFRCCTRYCNWYPWFV